MTNGWSRTAGPATRSCPSRCSWPACAGAAPRRGSRPGSGAACSAGRSATDTGPGWQSAGWWPAPCWAGLVRREPSTARGRRSEPRLQSLALRRRHPASYREPRAGRVLAVGRRIAVDREFSGGCGLDSGDDGCSGRRSNTQESGMTGERSPERAESSGRTVTVASKPFPRPGVPVVGVRECAERSVRLWAEQTIELSAPDDHGGDRCPTW